MDISKFEDRIAAIWNVPEFKDFVGRPYLYNKTIIPNSLLFVGLNPSFDEKTPSIGHFYELDQRVNGHAYFSKFPELSEHCKLSWSHLDLLFFRETNQRHCKELMKNQKGGQQFLLAQLKLSKEILIASKPKIIVVCNALSGELMGRWKDKKKEHGVWMDLDFQMDKTIGTPRWEDIPVFFTSMLAGQRALDKGSFERLKWHLKWVKDKI